MMRSRTRIAGVWGAWSAWRSRPTKARRICIVCAAPATAAEITTIVGAIVRRDGQVDRLPVTVSAPFYCDIHTGAPR